MAQGIAVTPFIPLVNGLKQSKLYAKQDRQMEEYIDMMNKYGKIYFTYFLFIPRLHVYDVDYFEYLFKTNNSCYCRNRMTKYFLGPLTGYDTMLIADDPMHSKNKKVILPIFHNVNLHSMISIMIKQTDILLNEWKNEKMSTTLDTKYITIQAHEQFSKLTLNIVANCVFGTGLQSIPNASEIMYNSLNQYFEIARERTLKLFSWISFIKSLPLFGKPELDRCVSNIHQIADQIIHDRRQGLTSSTIEKNDLLDLLFSVKDDQGYLFSNDLIKQETLAFIVAGHETSSNLMSWCIYCLVSNPDAMDDCIKEIDRVLKGELPTAESLKQLHVIDSVLHETLRLYPPAPLSGRDCLADNEIGHGDKKIKVYKGTSVHWNTYVLHRNPDYWQNPLKFDYTRWKDSNGERKQLAHPYCYLPFGAGHRSCIGQNFALLEARIMLTMILQKFRLELAPGQKITPHAVVTMKPKYGLLVKVYSRT
ncbi:unnamed protein product [Didymodactylos carnosus]|uniref:Cytochrome P450 n=1 Tax=Didymodactylos carnosus TaxID=1234261 RepID=A0A8S2FMH9_9BILA|nr:unnamed protein product [Didymodactylos carnosus]CAF4286203.1 unnamed protein product [Didymodactylos carnosus]